MRDSNLLLVVLCLGSMACPEPTECRQDADCGAGRRCEAGTCRATSTGGGSTAGGAAGGTTAGGATAGGLAGGTSAGGSAGGATAGGTSAGGAAGGTSAGGSAGGATAGGTSAGGSAGGATAGGTSAGGSAGGATAGGTSAGGSAGGAAAGGTSAGGSAGGAAAGGASAGGSAGGATAGGTSAGGSAGGATFSVVSTVPSSGATLVSPTAPLSATFSLDVDASALSAASTDLSFASSTVSIGYVLGHAATGPTLQATPTARLALLSPYRWTLTTALRATGGQPLASPVLVTFTTRDGVWSTPAPVESRVDAAQLPAVALDPFSTDALVVFQQPNVNGQRHPYAARFRAQTGALDAPVDLITGTNTALLPTVVTAPNSTALVGWLEAAGSFDLDPVVRRYSFTTGMFGAPVTIGPSPNPVSSLSLAMDDSGNGVAVYRQAQSTSVSAPGDCWFSRYTAATDTWSTPAVLESQAADCSAVAVTSDSAGNLAAAFVQGGDLFVTQSSGGAAWTSPLLMESRAGAAQLRRIEAARTGGPGLLWVVWIQEESVWARSYAPSTATWDAAAADIDGVNTNRPSTDAALAVRSNGEAVVVFIQTDAVGSLTRSAFATRHRTSWSAPVAIEALAGIASDPQIVLATTGPGMASFAGSTAFGGRLETYSVRFDGTAWQPEQVRSASPVASNTSMRMVVDGAGRVLGVWEFADAIGSTSIMSARFE